MTNYLTRSPLQRQIDHIGNIRHGVQTGPWRMEFPAPIKNDVATARDIFQGSVISLNADGQYILGCPAGSGVNRPVPFISLKNYFDPDVTTGVSDPKFGRSAASAVGGIITATPCTSGYELETTEYDTEATYHVNDGVIPQVASGEQTGKVTVATAAPGGADPYLGFVSIPPKTDYFDNKRLAFFSDYIPAGFGAGSASAVTDESGNEIKFAVTGTGSTVAWSVDADGALLATLS